MPTTWQPICGLSRSARHKSLRPGGPNISTAIVRFARFPSKIRRLFLSLSAFVNSGLSGSRCMPRSNVATRGCKIRILTGASPSCTRGSNNISVTYDARRVHPAWSLELAADPPVARSRAHRASGLLCQTRLMLLHIRMDKPECLLDAAAEHAHAVDRLRRARSGLF